MGIWNNNVDDDFVTPNGDILPPDSSEGIFSFFNCFLSPVPNFIYYRNSLF